VTDPLNIGIRFALYADLMLLFGLPLFGLYALKGAEQLQNAVLPLRSITVWLSLSGIILSLLGIVAMTASMAGVRFFEVDSASVSMMIFETTMGNAWLVRMLALVITLAAAQFLLRNSTPLWLSLVAFASAVTLSSLAWTGHGAASEGAAGTAQLIADITHLLGAGAWLGALAALTIMLSRGAQTCDEAHLRRTHRVLEGFSVTGTIIVALVLSSGLANSWMLVGPKNLLTLPATLYGQLLIAKLLLFALMLALAAANRFRLTPAFDRALQSGGTSDAIAKLRKSLAFELGIAFIILGLVAWLGTLEPPISI
jgi:copper resistance protein D